MNSRFVTLPILVLFTAMPLLSASLLSLLNIGLFYNASGAQQIFPQTNLSEYNEEVVSYLIGHQEAMPEEIALNEREVKHMADVKVLVLKFLMVLKFIIISIFLGAVLLYLVENKHWHRKLLGTIFYGSILSLPFLILAALLFLFAFDTSFAFFHTLFFTGDSWLFLPGDALILLYPEKFFRSIFLSCFILAILLSLLSTTASFRFRKHL